LAAIVLRLDAPPFGIVERIWTVPSGSLTPLVNPGIPGAPGVPTPGVRGAPARGATRS